MIVNIILSGLIGGIVIYTIQKKIDATIQKSVFEYQTKFSRTHPKILETLEGYNQIILNCSNLSYSFGMGIVFLLTGEVEVDIGEMKARRDELFATTGDSSRFMMNNRLHLPDSLIEELDKITYTAFKLILVSVANWDVHDKPAEEIIKHFYEASMFIGVSYEPTDSKAKDFELLVKKIGKEYHKLLNRLEKIYKSVAEAQ